MKNFVKILIFSLFLINTFAQSILIEPGKQGFNTNTVQSNTLEMQGNGILIQQPFVVSTVNPQSTVVILPNGSSTTATAESGLLKDPNGDNPYLTGIAFSANAYLNLSSGIGIKFTFELLDTEANGDSVIISDFNNVQIARYSGIAIPAELIIFSETSFTNKYYLKFKTDNDANVGQGFVLRWQTLFSNGTATPLVNIGGGSSMIFDRNKSAFRAGTFNKLNLKTIGQYSAAFGEKTEASGQHSFAGGMQSKSTGSASFAFGTSAEATTNAYSFGYFTKARGYDAFVTGIFNDILNPENSDSPTDRLFQIGNGSSEINRKNAITVLRNGKTGIGTTTPYSKLHVYNGNSGVSFVANSTAIFENSASHFITLATPESSETGVLFSKSTSGDASGGIVYGVNNSMFFRTNGNINRMAIGSTGRVGIGVDDPLKTIDVLSTTADATMQLKSTGAGNWSVLNLNSENSGGAEIILKKGPELWNLRTSGTSLLLDYSGSVGGGNIPALGIVPSVETISGFRYYSVIPAYQNYTQLGNSTNRFREIWSTNALNTSSDRRLKKNINEIKYGLQEILKLNAVSYNWKNSTDSKLHLGFIAQEVEKIVPEIVSKSNLPDDEYARLEKEGKVISDTYGMEYTSLIPVLVKAIQEQQRLIESKSLEINNLREGIKKFSDLETRMNVIETFLKPSNQKIDLKTDK
jgi:hypothetical protein